MTNEIYYLRSLIIPVNIFSRRYRRKPQNSVFLFALSARNNPLLLLYLSGIKADYQFILSEKNIMGLRYSDV